MTLQHCNIMKAPQILPHLKVVQQSVGYATLATSLKSLQDLQRPQRLFLKKHCNIRNTLKALQHLQHFYDLFNICNILKIPQHLYAMFF